MMYTATSASTAAAIFAAPSGQDWFEDTLRRIEQRMSARSGASNYTLLARVRNLVSAMARSDNEGLLASSFEHRDRCMKLRRSRRYLPVLILPLAFDSRCNWVPPPLNGA